MRFNKLDLNLIVALDALLTECSVTRAAARLHLSQSATSNALARLRDYFDDELLVQVGRKMELTPRSLVLKEAVRDVLLRVDTTLAAQPGFEPATAERTFKLCVSDYTTLVLMPQVLALAGAAAPGVRFELLPQADQPQRALERGETDLLVIPHSYCSPDHPTEVVYEDTFRCVLWQHSALARGEMTLARYLAAGHVLVQAGSGQAAFERWFVQQHGVSRRMEVSTPSFTAPMFLVVGTERIATVHARLARLFTPGLPVKVLPLPMEMPPMQQVMQWHKFRSADPGLVWLRRLLHDATQRIDGALPAAAAL